MIFVGMFLFTAFYLPLFAQSLRVLVNQHMAEVSYLGLASFFLGVVFLSLLIWLNRRRYFLFAMGTVSVQDRLIAYYAKESLQSLFPGQAVECDVIVKRKKKIEILANIPLVAEEKQESTLREVEQALISMLHKYCQYEREFILNVSFSVE